MRKAIGYGFSLGLVLLTVVAADAAPRKNPLEGQPAVRNRYEMRKGRFEVGPAFNITLNRAMRHNMLFGAKLEYHFLDYLSIGAEGGYGIGLNTGLNGELKDTYVTADEQRAWDLKTKAFADIIFAGDVRIAFTPLAGKLSLFSKLFVYYDFYAFAGVALAMTKNKGSAGDWGAGNDVDAANEGFRAGPAFGFGMHIFFNEWFSMGFEAKDLIFHDNETGGDTTRGLSDAEKAKNFAIIIDGDDKVFSQHWFFGVNFTFFLPPTTVISP